QENHLELISILAEQLSEGRVRQVEILVDSRPGSILSSGEQPATTTAALQTAPQQSIKVKKESDSVSSSPTTNSVVNPKTPKKKLLNPQFTFSLFVEGRSNQMAAETCRKVLTQLGASQHNP
ncbi:chromosomal replication initiator protein DnaA, partial [Acinetobacter baumannii]